MPVTNEVMALPEVLGCAPGIPGCGAPYCGGGGGGGLS